MTAPTTQNLAVVIRSVQDGANLEVLNNWCISNGLKEAAWYRADTLMVLDGHIIGSKIAENLALSERTRHEDVRVPLRVFPPPSIIKGTVSVGDTHA